MPTVVPVGHPLAKKTFSVGLFAGVQEMPGFMNLLSGPIPKMADFKSKMRGQSSPDYPVVKIMDMAKGAGALVSVDLFNILQGKPVMGDRRIAGKMMSTTSSSDDVYIDQYRGGADSGGRMTQKRTVHNLREVARVGLTNWAQRLEDQLCLSHLAGARGFQQTADWVVPLASDADFSSIVVNPITPPTKNRHFFANDATLPSDIGTNDALTFQDIDRIASVIAESSSPLQPVRIPGDEYGWNDPLAVMFVSERQWLYMTARTGQTAWRQNLRDAYVRRAQGVKHPLFYGDGGFWRGLIIKPLKRYAVRFPSGSAVAYDTGGGDGYTYTESSANTAVDVDRAVIVGAQALMKAYGVSAESEFFYDWNEEKVDHGNAVEIVLSMIGGLKKARFAIKNGPAGQDVITDHGVCVVDSYAPDPNSAAGRTLLAS